MDKPFIADAVKHACPECPFNRQVKPGRLGGSPVTTYVGQIAGPFVLACHMHCDFGDPKWKTPGSYTQTPQCAGAAIFRANLGLDRRMPDVFPRLPPDRETVFASFREFAEHHIPALRGSSLTGKLDNPDFVRQCLDSEISKTSVWRLPKG